MHTEGDRAREKWAEKCEGCCAPSRARGKLVPI